MLLCVAAVVVSPKKVLCLVITWYFATAIRYTYLIFGTKF